MSLPDNVCLKFQTFIDLNRDTLKEAKIFRKKNLGNINPNDLKKSEEILKKLVDFWSVHHQVITAYLVVSKSPISQQYTEIRRILRRFRRIPKLPNFPLSVSIKPLLKPGAGVSAFDIIPTEIETHIFQNLPTLNDMVRYSGVSIQRRNIGHNIGNWDKAKAFQKLLTNTTITEEEAHHFVDLLRVLCSDPSKDNFGRVLAREFFNSAHDEVLRLFLIRITKKDRKRFFELLEGEDLNRKTLSLGGSLWIKNESYTLSWLLPKLKKLEKLSLSGCLHLSDDDFQYIGMLTELRDLKLWGCGNVTGANLDKLAPLKALENLDISNCQKMKPENLEKLSCLNGLKNLDLSQLPDVQATHLLFLNAFSKVTVKH